MTLVLIGFLVCLFLSGVFSGMETGIYSMERVRLEVMAAAGDRRAARLLALVARPAAAVCTILVINNVVNYLVAHFSGEVLARASGAAVSDLELELVNTLCVVPVLFIFGELLPKDLFLRYPTRMVSLAQPLFEVAARLVWPIVFVLTRLLHRLGGAEGDDRAGGLFHREALHRVLTVENEAERLNASQRALARRVLALRAMRVRDWMRPLETVPSVPADAPASDILREGVRSGRSRLLVRSADGEDVDGYVKVLDAGTASGAAFDLARAVRPLVEVHPDDPVTEVLARLQAQRRPLALARDLSGPVGVIGAWEISEVLIAGPAQVQNGRQRRS